MFIPFVYELDLSRSLIMRWVFEKFLTFAAQEQGYMIAQEKYWNSKECFSDVSNVYVDVFDYVRPTQADRDAVTALIIPAKLDDDLVANEGSRLKAWIKLMQERYQPLETWLRASLEQVRATGAEIEGIIAWYPIKSLDFLSKVLNIPVIYIDLAPLRKPCYERLGYLDLVGTNCSAGNLQNLFTAYCEELLAAENWHAKLLTSKEILALLLADDYLCLLDGYDKEPSYEWGFVMEGTYDFYGMAVDNLMTNYEVLSFVRESVSAQEMLLRPHPADRFVLKQDIWPGAIDTSSTTEEFLLKCKRVITSRSKATFLSMLWGKDTRVLRTSPFACGEFFHSLDATEENKPNTAFINFTTFCYFVPLEFHNDYSYLRWWLSGPTFEELWHRNLSHHLSRVGLTIEELFACKPQERLHYILQKRGYS